jgi:hypothetical protein
MNALEAHAAKQTTTVLVDSLAILAAIGRTLTTEERMARFSIINAIEARYPQVDAATMAWCETADTTRTYEDVIFAALKELGVTA